MNMVIKARENHRKAEGEEQLKLKLNTIQIDLLKEKLELSLDNISTKLEIDYATKLNKEIMYYE